MESKDTLPYNICKSGISLQAVDELLFFEVYEQDIEWGLRWNIMRVHHGWIYTPINRPLNGKDEYLPSVFVPST